MPHFLFVKFKSIVPHPPGTCDGPNPNDSPKFRLALPGRSNAEVLKADGIRDLAQSPSDTCHEKIEVIPENIVK